MSSTMFNDYPRFVCVSFNKGNCCLTNMVMSWPMKRESRNIPTNQDSRFDWQDDGCFTFALMGQRMYKDLATIGVQNSK